MQEKLLEGYKRATNSSIESAFKMAQEETCEESKIAITCGNLDYAEVVVTVHVIPKGK